MMDEKEKWIQETLQSVNKPSRIEVSPLLAQRLQNIALNGVQQMPPAPNPIIPWLAAASIALLLGINILTALWYNDSASYDISAAHTVYSEYFDYLETLN